MDAILIGAIFEFSQNAVHSASKSKTRKSVQLYYSFFVQVNLI